MTTRRALAAAIIATLFAIWACNSEPPAGAKAHVRIAAASDLKFALPDLVLAFSSQRPDIEVEATFGASGSFFAQLSQGAPFDVFLSADLDYPRRLVEAGLARGDTLSTYAVGKLVLWVPMESRLPIESRGMDVLRDPTVKKVAIANPAHAPYGRAAEAALRRLGLYDAIAPRLVLGENVAQAAQFAQSGAADAGIIGHSLASSSAMKSKGRFVEIPADAYPPLEQGCVAMKAAQDAAATDSWLAFLKSRAAGDIFSRHGFTAAHKE